MRPRFPVLVLLVLPFLVTAAPSCGSGEDSSRATAEAAPVAAYWDTDIDTGT